MKINKVGVIGAGTMGRGIAQVAAQNGHNVILVDANSTVLESAKASYQTLFEKIVAKGKMTNDEAETIKGRIQYAKLNKVTNRLLRN
jgi:3-hydroxybutyryl-CoA dehydrogenase